MVRRKQQTPKNVINVSEITVHSVKGPARIELDSTRTARRSHRWLGLILLVLFSISIILTTVLWLYCLPKGKSWVDVPDSQSQLSVLVILPGALGRGDTGKLRISVANRGEKIFKGVKVFWSCAGNSSVVVEAGEGNLLYFGTLAPHSQKTLESAVFVGQDWFGKVRFKITIEWEGLEVSKEMDEDWECIILPIPVQFLIEKFWLWLASSFLTAIASLALEFLTRQLNRKEEG